MSTDGVGPRYDVTQIVEAVGRARGDGRCFLVRALTKLPVEQREDALSQVLSAEMRPDERQIVLGELTRLRPATYLASFIATGLRSRSINVQQTTLAALPALVEDRLPTELGDQIEGWLRRRLANPRRENTWATWEIPAVALALLPSHGTDRVVGLIAEIEPRMQPEERQRWRSLERLVGEPEAFWEGLVGWFDENVGPALDSDPRDPTADVAVDRAMKRLGYSPANPESQVFDPLAEFDVPMYVIDVSDEQGFVKNK